MPILGYSKVEFQVRKPKIRWKPSELGTYQSLREQLSKHLSLEDEKQNATMSQFCAARKYPTRSTRRDFCGMFKNNYENWAWRTDFFIIVIARAFFIFYIYPKYDQGLLPQM